MALEQEMVAVRYDIGRSLSYQVKYVCHFKKIYAKEAYFFPPLYII